MLDISKREYCLRILQNTTDAIKAVRGDLSDESWEKILTSFLDLSKSLIEDELHPLRETAVCTASWTGDINFKEETQRCVDEQKEVNKRKKAAVSRPNPVVPPRTSLRARLSLFMMSRPHSGKRQIEFLDLLEDCVRKHGTVTKDNLVNSRPFIDLFPSGALELFSLTEIEEILALVNGNAEVKPTSPLLATTTPPSATPSATPSSTPSTTPSTTPSPQPANLEEILTLINADLDAQPAELTFLGTLTPLLKEARKERFTYLHVYLISTGGMVVEFSNSAKPTGKPNEKDLFGLADLEKIAIVPTEFHRAREAALWKMDYNW